MVRLLERHRQRRHAEGFTLIELLVVIAIIGVLSAIVVFSVQGIRDHGQAAAAATDAQIVRTAEEAYRASHPGYGTIAQLMAAGLLASTPGYTQVYLNNSGPGGGTNSGFSLAQGVVNVAANADQWVVGDTNSGPGYSSSAFTYPLNSNLNEPLVIMNSSLQPTPGLAISWQDIPVGTNRTTFPGMTGTGTTALPSSPSTYPTCGGISDRPFCFDTWRFHIRQGVTFHDGQPLTADDVIWTLRDRQALSASQSDGINNLAFTMMVATKPAGCNSSQKLCGFDSVEEIDKYTVDITPFQQDLRLPDQLVHPKGAIVEVLRDGSGNPIQAPASMQTPGLSVPRFLGRHLDGSTGGLPVGVQIFGVAGSPASTPLVAGCTQLGQSGCGVPEGTGPFQFQSWHPTSPQGGGTASFTAYANYWGQGPQVAQMNYTFISDPTVRTAGLESGQFDMDIDINPLDTAGAQAKGFRVVSAPYGQNTLIYVNKVVKTSPATLDSTKVAPQTPANYTFNIGTDPAVREAASFAIDRNAIVSSIFAGNAAPGQWMAPPVILGCPTPANGVCPAGTPAADVPPLQTNVATAASLLDADGWTCGGGAPGAGTACGASETRAWHGDSRFTTGRPLTLYMIGISLVPQTEYSLMSSQMAAAGINMVTERAHCDSTVPCPDTSVGRGQMYASSLWDFDVELPNQNDSNPAFLPVLRMACLSESSTFRFAPADGTNGVGAAVNDSAGNGGGVYPNGNTPCSSAGSVRGAFDNTYVPGSNNAATDAQAAVFAGEQMAVLVNQTAAASSAVGGDFTNVVIPVVGQYRIYGMSSKVNLGDPNPSQTSQRWVSLTKSS